MTTEHPLKSAIERTVWIARMHDGFAAFNFKGGIIAHHKHQSTLKYILRQKAVEYDIHAIATVVLPHHRQPNRAVSIKHKPKWRSGI